MAPAGVRLQQPVVSEARAAGERASATCQRTTQLRRLIHPPNLTPTLSTLHPSQGRILRAAFCCFVPGYSGGPRRRPVASCAEPRTLRPALTPLPHAHKPRRTAVSVSAEGFLSSAMFLLWASEKLYFMDRFVIKSPESRSSAESPHRKDYRSRLRQEL
jgi:hypothetical protein